MKAETMDAIAGSGAISVKGLGHRYGKQPVLNNICFEVDSGSIVGLLGPSGSGKTTLIRIMTGLLKPASGTVSIAGLGVPSPALAARMGYMAQFDALYDDLSGLQNLLFFASLYGLRGKPARNRVEELLDLTRLEGHENKVVHQYSGGMRKRLSLAITLLHRPSVLFLDEPTVGIDPVLRAEFWAEFRSLAAAGTTIVLSTHVMDEASRCDRLGLLFEGELLSWDTPDGLMGQTKTHSVEESFLALRGNGRGRE